MLLSMSRRLRVSHVWTGEWREKGSELAKMDGLTLIGQGGGS